MKRKLLQSLVDLLGKKSISSNVHEKSFLLRDNIQLVAYQQLLFNQSPILKAITSSTDIQHNVQHYRSYSQQKKHHGNKRNSNKHHNKHGSKHHNKHDSNQGNNQSNNQNDNQNNNQGNTQNNNGRWHFITKGLSAWVGGGIAGYAIANILPTSFKEENFKEVRRKIGTDILEIENQHIIPAPRDYSQCIERIQSIYKIDKLFDYIEQERSYREASPWLPSNISNIISSNARQRGISTLLITGVQGSGKSELAEEYADKYAAKISAILPSSVRTIKVFRAENIDDLKQQYREFAKELGVDAQNHSDDSLIIEVNKKLALRDHWLLVFDNVNTKQNYKLIMQLTPKENTCGRVILTARERSIIPEKDSLNIKIMDITQTKYRFTIEEAVSLIDQTLSNSPLKHSLPVEYKIELAKQLHFLPQALKKATLYIKHFKNCKDIGAYQKNVTECSQERFNTSAFNEFDEYRRCEVINDSVNMLSIRAVSENSLATAILTFSAFLNPDCIQREMLELNFVKFKGVKKEEFINALELLRNYGLFEDKGQEHFKMHRSITQSVLSAVPMAQWKNGNRSKLFNEYYKDSKREENERKFIQKELDSVIDFTKQFFKRDNTEVDARRRNALFVVHANTLQEIYHQYGLKNNSTTLESALIVLSFRINLATHYMMTGNTVKGREILKALIEEQSELKQKLDNLYVNKKKLITYENLKASLQSSATQSKGNMQDDQEVSSVKVSIQSGTDDLSSKQTSILSLYAQALYHFGCTYYDIGDKGNNHIYEKSLEQAIIVRKIIDEKIKNNPQEWQEDAKFNEFDLDSKIMRRNGILKFRYKETSIISNLECIAAKYEEMIKEEISKPKNQQDKKYIRSCRSELSRVYQKIATKAINDVQKHQYYEKATKVLYSDEVQNAFSSINGQEQIDYETIFKWILANSDLQKDTRKARYLNDLGNLLNLQDNYALATSCYIEAISLIEEKENVNVDLPTSYLGLALVCEKQNKIDLAEKAIKRCLFAQEILGIPKENEEAMMARDVSCRIKRKIPLENIMKKLKIH